MDKHSNIFVDQLFPDQQLTVSYSKKSLIELYHRIKNLRDDLYINLNEFLTEEDIDDYINDELENKIILKGDCYWKELVEHVYSNTETEYSIDYFLEKFYNKPIIIIVLALNKNIQNHIDNLDSVVLRDLNHYSLKKYDSDINFDELFTNEYDNCLLYYINFCQNQGCDTNVDLHKELYDSVNYKKVDDLLGHESEEVRNILKLCYEDRA